MKVQVCPPGTDDWQDVPAEHVKVLRENNGPGRLIDICAFMADKQGWQVRYPQGYQLLRMRFSNPFAGGG